MKHILFSEPSKYIEAIARMDNLTISEQFLVCADTQLRNEYERKTGLKVGRGSLYLILGNAIYKKGNISTLNAKAYVNHRHLLTNICWQSKSGRIYDMADTDIDCQDIEFWLNPIEKDKGILYLFFDAPFQKERLKKNLHIDVSELFLEIADTKLRKDFEAKTGLKINSRISIDWGKDDLKYSKAEVSSIEIQLIIGNNDIDGELVENYVRVCWQSKSGRIYDMSDEDIDENDIIFWFEGLNPISYHKQLYPNDKQPFKLKNINFEVDFQRLHVEQIIEIYLDDENEVSTNQIVNDIEKFINQWNTKTEKDDLLNQTQGVSNYESKGVVHNIRTIENMCDKIVLDIDMGNSDIIILKKLIEMLNKKHKAIKKMIIN